MKKIEIFEHIRSATGIDAYPWLNTQKDSEELDELLNFEYIAYKRLYSKVEELLNTGGEGVLGRMIVRKYQDTWDNRMEMELTVYEGNTRTQTEEYDETLDSERQNNSVDSISAANSPVMVEDSAKASDGTDKSETVGNKKMEDIRIYAKDKYDLLSKEVKASIIHTVLTDVSNFLTLRTY